ncbi:MAG: hypothetical protein CL793_07540 [Chloroflexi bacterium]|nr:hypothetical protein [Chloroflexota bacterium]
MGTACFYCGDDWHCELLEAWERPGGGFDLIADTCCEMAHDDFLLDFGETSRNSKGRVGRPLRREFSQWWAMATGLQSARVSGNCVVLPIELVRCGKGSNPDDPRVWTLESVKQFVRENHRHAPAPPAGWRWGYTIWAGDFMLGVAMVGRPAARRIDGTKVIDVSRVCVSRRASAEVAENACSMVYARAARDGAKAGFERVITYTIAGEPAAGCRAAGMEVEHRSRSGNWNRAGRRRNSRNSTRPKVRWGKECAKPPMEDCGNA